MLSLYKSIGFLKNNNLNDPTFFNTNVWDKFHRWCSVVLWLRTKISIFAHLYFIIKFCGIQKPITHFQWHIPQVKSDNVNNNIPYNATQYKVYATKLLLMQCVRGERARGYDSPVWECVCFSDGFSSGSVDPDSPAMSLLNWLLWLDTCTILIVISPLEF